VPEGDTIHRVANRLRPALLGQPLVRLEAPRARGLRHRPPAGTEVTAVEAVGKHLLVRFADGTTLRTHLRMSGSWHLYRTGERWQQPDHLVRALVEVPGWVAVCFAAPVVELEHDATGGPRVRHLGPDLTRADLTDEQLDECVERLATIADRDAEIGAVLLDQRIACGVGNIYKSEALWAAGVDPFAAVGDLDTPTRRRLLEVAHRQLVANVAVAGGRVTYRSAPTGGASGRAVYGRRGRPCPRCGTPIKMQRQGEHARSTYWCPTCQRTGGPTT
jgi:endonuclease-8